MSRNHSSYVGRVSSPKTPSNTNLASNIPVHFTPVEQCAETERDPEPLHKEQPIKKKTSHVSKRKLFLQSGQNSKVNKVKKQVTPTQPKTSFTSKKVPISPPCQADATRFSYPLTERQQLQYLLEVTAKEAKHESGSASGDDLTVSSSKMRKKEYHRESQAEYRVRKRNERGETALHLAAIRGDLDDLILLLQAGALVNVKDNAGWTPLHEACNYGNLRIVQELVWSGADVNCPGYEAITPLHDAVINDHVKVVQFLISNGADLSLQTSQNYNVLDLARSAAMLDLLTQQHNKDSTTSCKDNVSVLVPPMITQPLPCKTYHIVPDLITNGIVSHVVDQERHQYNESSQSSLENRASQTPLSTEPCTYGPVGTTSIKRRQMEEENFHPQAMSLSKENCHQLPGERLVSKADNQITDLSAADNDSQDNGIPRNSNKVELPCLSHDGGREVISLPEAVFVKPVNGATKFSVGHSQLPSVLETDDSILPEKLNECLDKALIEISTYLENSQNIPAVHKEKMSANFENDEDVCNKVSAHVEDNTPKDSNIPDSQQKAGTFYRGMGTEVEYVPCTDVSKEMESRTDACDATAMERMTDDTDIGEKSDTGFTRIKTRYERKRATSNNSLQVDRSSKPGRKKKPSTRISECEKSERNDYNQVKEECLNHIFANRTWRSDLPKYRYNVSSLPLCLPGYEDFLINSRSDMLTWSCLSFDQSCLEKENHLKKVLTQHYKEKVKLRMALEQELVRVFANFARRSVGFSVPYGACTVIGSQMRPQEAQISHSEEMDRGSIKLEVDKILKKFSQLEFKMLRRQRHEFDAAIAFEKLTTDNRDFNGSASIFTAKCVEHYSRHFIYFDLVPAKFAEYYEEVLCAPEQIYEVASQRTDVNPMLRSGK